MKPISSKHVINKQSALPTDSKRNILISDLVRIMRNVSPQCEEHERMKHIKHFIQRMQYSGYNESERKIVYHRANQRFNKIIMNDKNNLCPLYRSKFWRKEEREKEKIEKRYNWFDNEKYDTVMFVDATRNNYLQKHLQNVFCDNNLMIKVKERSGTSIKRQLSKSDPFKNKSCAGENCNICTTNTNNNTTHINCKTRDVVYEITCECGDQYIGETSRSISERYNEHIASMRRKEKQSVLHRHLVEKQHDINTNFKLRVLANCPKDAMLRQVTEAVYINEKKPAINAKEEWGNKNNPRRRVNDVRNEDSVVMITNVNTTTSKETDN